MTPEPIETGDAVAVAGMACRFPDGRDGMPLRAGASSFGAGGSNANKIMEEAATPAASSRALLGEWVGHGLAGLRMNMLTHDDFFPRMVVPQLCEMVVARMQMESIEQKGVA